MARYGISGPFQFRTRTGETQYYNPAIEATPTLVFDTADARWDLAPGWQPPVVGLRPLDQDAADALVAVRALCRPAAPRYRAGARSRADMDSVMARFHLTAPHILVTNRGPALVEAGTDVSSADYVNFACSPHMTALDSEAEALLAAECDRLRAEAGDFGTVIGYGSTQTLPA